MIELSLAVGLVAVAGLSLWFMYLQIGRLTDQNQLLISALMATKSSPFAPVAAATLDMDDEAPMVKVHSDVPEGTRLLGTTGRLS